MALKLSLKPGERFVINGAVVANGERRSSLIIHNKASILREKDIMQEHEVNTPAKRLYFPVMLMYLDEGDTSKFYEDFVMRMTEFMNAISSSEAIELCVNVSKDVMNKNYYKAVIGCKKLIKFEQERLQNVA